MAYLPFTGSLLRFSIFLDDAGPTGVNLRQIPPTMWDYLSWQPIHPLHRRGEIWRSRSSVPRNCFDWLDQLTLGRDIRGRT